MKISFFFRLNGNLCEFWTEKVWIRAWNETLIFYVFPPTSWLCEARLSRDSFTIYFIFQTPVYSEKSIALAARDLRFMWTWYDWVKKGWRSEWALNKAHENGWLRLGEKKITRSSIDRLHTKINMSYDSKRITHEKSLSSFLEFDQLMQWVSHVNFKSSKWK